MTIEQRLERVEIDLKKVMTALSQVQEMVRVYAEEYDLLRRIVYLNNIHLNPGDRGILYSIVDQATKDQ